MIIVLQKPDILAKSASLMQMLDRSCGCLVIATDGQQSIAGNSIEKAERRAAAVRWRSVKGSGSQFQAAQSQAQLIGLAVGGERIQVSGIPRRLGSRILPTHPFLNLTQP